MLLWFFLYSLRAFAAVLRHHQGVNHFRFDSILSFREDTADENLTVVISCVGREANAMQIGGTFKDFMPN